MLDNLGICSCYIWWSIIKVTHHFNFINSSSFEMQRFQHKYKLDKDSPENNATELVVSLLTSQSVQTKYSDKPHYLFSSHYTKLS